MRIISQLFSLKTELLIIRLNNDFSMYNPSGSQPKRIKKKKKIRIFLPQKCMISIFSEYIFIKQFYQCLHHILLQPRNPLLCNTWVLLSIKIHKLGQSMFTMRSVGYPRKWLDLLH